MTCTCTHHRFMTITLIALTLLISGRAQAGNFSVSPLDVQFSEQQRSTVLTVTNDDDKPLTLRVRAMRWTQDAQGNDSYEPSQELVFFPRRLDLQAGDKRIIRVGTNGTGNDENAYRLFIDEVPQVQAEGGQSRLAVLVSFGIPVFVTPAQAEAALAVQSASLAEDGQLLLQVHNEGASRVRISRLMDDKGELLSESLASRYVFPGIRKEYRIALQQPVCGNEVATLKLETDRGTTDVTIRPTHGC